MSRGGIIEPSAHNMLVYDSLTTLRDIFANYAAELLPKNEIVLLASQYDALDKIKIALADAGVDIAKHLQDGTLFIVDAQKGYQGADIRGTFKLAMSLIMRARKENRRGVSWFGDMGSFFAFEKLDELLDYEIQCPTTYEPILKTICCYHRADFNRLQSQHKDKLLNHHYKSIIVDR